MNINSKRADIEYREYRIDHQAWPEYKSNVKASAHITFAQGHLLVRFIVTEPFVKVRFRESNEDVHHDSCVELFLRFDQDESYYNLELNALGNIKLAYGKNRVDRVKVPAKIIGLIKRELCLKPCDEQGPPTVKWMLSATIPVSVFYYHQLRPLSDHLITGNFYKCGSSCGQPHYLSWSPISSSCPDFHRPEFFKPLW